MLFHSFPSRCRHLRDRNAPLSAWAEEGDPERSHGKDQGQNAAGEVALIAFRELIPYA